MQGIHCLQSITTNAHLKSKTIFLQEGTIKFLLSGNFTDNFEASSWHKTTPTKLYSLVF